MPIYIKTKQSCNLRTECVTGPSQGCLILFQGKNLSIEFSSRLLQHNCIDVSSNPEDLMSPLTLPILYVLSLNQYSGCSHFFLRSSAAPCQPSQVQAYTDCQSKAVIVSWDPSYVAQSYLLTAVSRDGDLKTCNTLYNNCTLTDLHCSSTYNLSVLANNENSTSLPSTNVTFKTGKSDETSLNSVTKIFALYKHSLQCLILQHHVSQPM